MRSEEDAVVRALGNDVAREPRQAYAGLMRRFQFGVIQPSTKTRVDLGLKLPGKEALQATHPTP